MYGYIILAYLFTYWWIYGLFPGFGYCEKKWLWTLVCKSLFRHIFSFVLDKYLEAEWPGCMVDVGYLSKELPKSFPKRLYHFTFTSAVFKSSVAPYLSLQIRYPIVALVCMSDMTNDVEYLSVCIRCMAISLCPFLNSQFQLLTIFY